MGIIHGMHQLIERLIFQKHAPFWGIFIAMDFDDVFFQTCIQVKAVLHIHGFLRMVTYVYGQRSNNRVYRGISFNYAVYCTAEEFRNIYTGRFFFYMNLAILLKNSFVSKALQEGLPATLFRIFFSEMTANR